MTKITFYNHHFWCFHVLKAAVFVAIFGLLAHIAFFAIQVHRHQYLSVLGHVLSITCYVILLIGLRINRTNCFLPYLILNPPALLVQILVEIHAHYKFWWKRKNFRWVQQEYLVDLGLLIVLVVLIILTHCLMVSIIYRAFRCLKDLSEGHIELNVELAEAEEFQLDEGFSGECSSSTGGQNGTKFT
ncbi:hypothetical protein M3Y97_00184400 [Aphelenchoides bicaudatus]|nr:hypothetical protein M3Y97_00184400 [Aphelenchoides bicaudatus]